MEERLEESDGSGALEDLESLVIWCRNAASLQPDGTKLPATRCEVRVIPCAGNTL